jgi:hypothetical protein
MYYWSHAEIPAAVPSTPGRLSSTAWPPTSPFGFSVATEVANAAVNRPGARYTEAGVCNVSCHLTRIKSLEGYIQFS